jgi:ADP-heptose:LPS heptosyltransferase
MRFRLMRLVDQFLGSLLCRSIGLVLWVCRLHIRRADHPAPPEPAGVREILVLKFLGMGSVLQATPLFQALRRHYPASRVTLLTFQANRALKDFDLGIDALVTVDPSGLWRFVASTVKALWQLRRTRFDVVLNLEFFAAYGTLLTWMLRKRFAVAFGGFAHYRDKFFHDFVSYDSAQHIQEKFFNFARRLGYRGALPPLAKLHVGHPAQVVAEAERRLGFRLEPDDYRILVNINTGEMAPRRRWPAEHYRVIIEGLLRRPGVRCLLLGGPGDREPVDAFQASLSRPEQVVNLAGRIDLRELVALMEVSDLYLGNDSGPLHFAACVGLPVLALFGPESPQVYGPPVSPRNTVLYRAEPCSPCLNVYSDKHSRCQDNVCLKRIPPEQVLEVLDRRYLNGKVKAGAPALLALPLVEEPVSVS